MTNKESRSVDFEQELGNALGWLPVDATSRGSLFNSISRFQPIGPFVPRVKSPLLLHRLLRKSVLKIMKCVTLCPLGPIN